MDPRVAVAAALALAGAGVAGFWVTGMVARRPAAAPEIPPNAPRNGENSEGEYGAMLPTPVDLGAEYDLAGLTIPRDQIVPVLPRDAIPALTDPPTEPVRDARWLEDDDRVVVVTIDGDVLGVPLDILDFHEIVNTTVGGRPIAVTYCPLCDSAAVFARNVRTPAEEGGGTDTLEFGVSGALYQSNVLMYDRRDRGLWSQLGMRAVSGPLAGVALETLPFEMRSARELREGSPDTRLVSRNTGHFRPYGQSPYAGYASTDALFVPVVGERTDLPRKTLGVGVHASGSAWFVPADRIGREGVRLGTPVGEVLLRVGPAGVATGPLPSGVQAVQTYYFAWSALYPDTAVYP